MAIDIEQTRKDKAELQEFLIANNIMYHYIGVSINVAEYIILLGLDATVDFSLVPDNINKTKIKKELSRNIVAR